MTVLDFTRRKFTFTELTQQVPNSVFHELYYRNYLDMERRAKQEAAKKKVANSNKQPQTASGSRLPESSFDEGGFEQQLEELMEEGVL